MNFSSVRFPHVTFLPVMSGEVPGEVFSVFAPLEGDDPVGGLRAEDWPLDIGGLSTSPLTIALAGITLLESCSVLLLNGIMLPGESSSLFLLPPATTPVGKFFVRESKIKVLTYYNSI